MNTLAATLLKQVLLACVLVLAAATATAQTVLTDLTPSQRVMLEQAAGGAATGSGDVSVPPSQTDWRKGTYGPVLDEQTSTDIQPFGADLFNGGFRGLRADGLNPQYRILPGDQITLRIWGAVEIERVLPVDAQGNIFIPSVGPVKVEGITHSQLDATVRQAVKRVYPDNVNVYTNLQGVQPVAVFVTGFVAKPGRYVGVPSDSVLYLIDQASGIDAELGSYRRVKLIRGGETLATLDLYDFILTGNLSHPQLQDGDTVLVEKRGPVVTVIGDVGRSYRYELQSGEMNGAALAKMARLKAGVSHVLVRGHGDEGPEFRYQTVQEFAASQLRDGDELVFLADQRQDSIVVQLEGAYLGRSYYVVPKGTTLHELLNGVAIDPEETAYESISMRRESVAARQKEALEESLRRLETTFLGASSSTMEESAIRIREAELITQFVQRARQLKPSGRLVVAEQGRLVDVRLQDRDVITLPARTDSIIVSGEVYLPQSVVYLPGKKAMDYIEGAGGFSQHADPDHILVARQNGEVRRVHEVELRPGDEIMVMPKVETKSLQIASTVTQILYQIAVATKVALDL